MKKEENLFASLFFIFLALCCLWLLVFGTGCAGYRWAPTSGGRILPYVPKTEVLVANLRSYTTCFTQVTDDGYPALGAKPLCLLPGREEIFELVPHLSRVKVYGLKGINGVELLYGLYFHAHDNSECPSVDKLWWNGKQEHCNILVLYGYPVTTYTGSNVTEAARMQWPDSSIRGLIKEEVTKRGREFVRDIFFVPQSHVPSPPTPGNEYQPEGRERR